MLRFAFPRACRQFSAAAAPPKVPIDLSRVIKFSDASGEQHFGVFSNAGARWHADVLPWTSSPQFVRLACCRPIPRMDGTSWSDRQAGDGRRAGCGHAARANRSDQHHCRRAQLQEARRSALSLAPSCSSHMPSYCREVALVVALLQETGLAAPERPGACACASLVLRLRASHACDSGAAVICMKATSSVIGHGSFIVIPRIAQQPPEVDYEGELAVVIDKPCRNVSEDQALSFVMGYTIANDVTARRWQVCSAAPHGCCVTAFVGVLRCPPVAVCRARRVATSGAFQRAWTHFVRWGRTLYLQARCALLRVASRHRGLPNTLPPSVARSLRP